MFQCLLLYWITNVRGCCWRAGKHVFNCSKYEKRQSGVWVIQQPMKPAESGYYNADLDAVQNPSLSLPLTVALKQRVSIRWPNSSHFYQRLPKRMQTTPPVDVKRQPIIFFGWNVISFIFRDQDVIAISQKLELVFFLFSWFWTWISYFASFFQKTLIAIISELFLTVGNFGWGLCRHTHRDPT